MKFYVYQLVDPRDASVFYVGKGKAHRAWQHELDARRGRVCNQRKHDRILDIVASGHGVTVEMVAHYDDEAQAFDHEAELIAALPNLTNILAHGGGWALTKDEAERRLQVRLERKVQERHASTVVNLKEWLAKIDKWPGVTFPNLANGDTKAAEFVALVRELVAA